ncbi:MAG: zinc ribbon domain-containing protein [Deltaproteobacteria bacterium]|nr:zinc ribbon domain-containing protein [Deltaproteobacteria bacterium]
MPIYEFKCLDCGHDFEELVLSRSETVTCPGCGEANCEKHLSSFRCGPSGGSMDLASGSPSSSSSCGSCSSSSCAGCGVH